MNHRETLLWLEICKKHFRIINDNFWIIREMLGSKLKGGGMDYFNTVFLAYLNICNNATRCIKNWILYLNWRFLGKTFRGNKINSKFTSILNFDTYVFILIPITVRGHIEIDLIFLLSKFKFIVFTRFTDIKMNNSNCRCNRSIKSALYQF